MVSNTLMGGDLDEDDAIFFQSPLSHTPTSDMDILIHALRCPFRAKSNYAREHLTDILRLVEHGLLTTYDPAEQEFGGTFYVTDTGATAVWAVRRPR